MQNIRPFQIALLAAFALIAIVSLAILASFQGFNNDAEQAYGDRVLIWGVLEGTAMNRVIDSVRAEDPGFNVVQYVQKDARTFEDELVNAIAEGRGPDAVIVPHEMLVTLRTKLAPVPYETFSERNFRDRFVEGAEIFARTDGIYAIPLVVDPLVMYWNRDSFSANGFSGPPSTWETLVGNVVPVLTEISVGGSVVRSAVAFGEYTNVTNAKEMLLTLMMQSGSRLITESGSDYAVVLDTPPNANVRPPATAAVQFYTNFSNPNSALYSWNRSLQNDRTAFLANDLALYFGFASDVANMSERNPNLNFDVAIVPQGAGATVKRTYGTFYGIAIVRSSQNIQGAYAAAFVLGQDSAVAVLAEQLPLVPASRSLIADGSQSAYGQVAYDSALIARGWLDPGPEESDAVFQQMIDDIVSGRYTVAGAVVDTVNRLRLAF